MKHRFLWCIVGMVISVMIYTLIHSIHRRPRNFSLYHPASENDLAPDWMKNAYAGKIGRYVMIASADSLKASAWIHPSHSVFPAVIFSDDDNDGRLDNIQIFDSRGSSFSIDDKDGDGEFDGWSYSPGIESDTFVFSDGDMDGLYDYRMDSEGTRTVRINSQWYDLTSKDKKAYVSINGKLAEVKRVNGIWSLLKSSNVQGKDGEEEVAPEKSPDEE